MSTEKTVKVTLVRSPIAIQPRHKLCIKGLGLRKINQVVEVADTPSNRGLIGKISYLVKVEG